MVDRLPERRSVSPPATGAQRGEGVKPDGGATATVAGPGARPSSTESGRVIPLLLTLSASALLGRADSKWRAWVPLLRQRRPLDVQRSRCTLSRLAEPEPPSGEHDPRAPVPPGPGDRDPAGRRLPDSILRARRAARPGSRRRGAAARPDRHRGSQDYKFHWTTGGRRSLNVRVYQRRFSVFLLAGLKSFKAFLKVLLR